MTKFVRIESRVYVCVFNIWEISLLVLAVGKGLEYVQVSGVT